MKRMSKIIASVMALVLMLGAVMVFSSAETDNIPTLGEANVCYKDALALAFTVNAEGETAGIAVYESMDAAEGNYMYITFQGEKDGDRTFYETFAIDAKDVRTSYYVAAVSKDAEGKITYGEKIEWSVAKYIDAKLEAGATAAQTNLFNKVLTYGDAAAKVLNK